MHASLSRDPDLFWGAYSLDHLFGKNMLRACKILDEGGVRRVTGAPSGRSLFLVGSRTLPFGSHGLSCCGRTSRRSVG